jgi:ribonuclease HII
MPIVNPTFEYEAVFWEQGMTLIAGVDEVGAGCLAGPVVTSAVVLPHEVNIDKLRDSKTLSPAQREKIALQIKEVAVAWAIGLSTPTEIDEINIRQADFLAMRRALAGLGVEYHVVLSDGFAIPGLTCHQQAIIKGDQKSKSIAAASIVAKVYRDALMVEYEKEFPGYGFAQHKGYGTAEHCLALKNLGPCPIHRKSYAPVREAQARLCEPSTIADNGRGAAIP